jgi:hypothetical protein
MPSLRQTNPPAHPAVHNPVVQSPAMQQGQDAPTNTYFDYYGTTNTCTYTQTHKRTCEQDHGTSTLISWQYHHGNNMARTYLTRAWQNHMAKAWQDNGNNMARTWQQ